MVRWEVSVLGKCACSLMMELNDTMQGSGRFYSWERRGVTGKLEMAKGS